MERKAADIQLRDNVNAKGHKVEKVSANGHPFTIKFVIVALTNNL